MGELRRPDEVADGVDPRHRCLVAVVHGDPAAVGTQAEGGQPEPAGVAGDTHGHEDALALHLGGALGPLEGHGGAPGPGRGLHTGDPHAGVHLHAVGLQAGGEHRRRLRVFSRQDLRLGLEQDHPRAEGAVERRELHADGAGADDHQGTGTPRQNHGLAAGDDALAVDLDAGQTRRPSAGGQQHPLRPQADGVAVVGDHLHLPGRGEPPPAAHHLDAVLLHQGGDAARQFLDDAAAAADHPLPVVADVAGGEAELLRPAQQPQHLGLAQQGLGGDAAPVEAGASETLLGLDQDGAQAELGGADGGGAASGAAADDDEIDRFAHDVDGKRGNALI